MLNNHLITGQFPDKMHPHIILPANAPEFVAVLQFYSKHGIGKCLDIGSPLRTVTRNHLFPCRAHFYFKYSSIFFGALSPALCDGFRCILLAQVFK
jgi:hypothetical protein